MSVKMNKKLVNIISFTLILALGFVLLSKLYGLFQKGLDPTQYTTIYILVLLMILVAFVQFILNLGQKNELEPGALIATPDAIEEKESHTQNVDVEKNPEEGQGHPSKAAKNSVDIKEIVGRVVPNKLATVEEFGETILMNLSKEFEIAQAILSVKDLETEMFNSLSFYAYYASEKPTPFKLGESLPGQVAKSCNIMQIDNVPEDYVLVISGLGSGLPRHLLLVPVVKDNETIAVFELATFFKFDQEHLELFNALAQKISNTIYAYIKGTEKVKNDKE
jgi:GAF domain-containing protein